MNVLVSVPNTGWIHKHVAFALLKVYKDKRHKVNIIMPTHVPVEVNYNLIVKDFYDGDYQYWLNIDSDNPPTKNPLDLIDLDLDIVGLPTPVYHNTTKNIEKGERPFYVNGYRYNEAKMGYNEWEEKKGLQEVDAIGSGCMLINRRVFADKVMRIRPFEIQMDEFGGIAKGSDLNFCEKSKRQGFKIHMHYDYLCRHFNEVELVEAIEGFGSIKNGRHTN